MKTRKRAVARRKATVRRLQWILVAVLAVALLSEEQLRGYISDIGA